MENVKEYLARLGFGEGHDLLGTLVGLFNCHGRNGATKTNYALEGMGAITRLLQDTLPVGIERKPCCKVDGLVFKIMYYFHCLPADAPAATIPLIIWQRHNSIDSDYAGKLQVPEGFVQEFTDTPFNVFRLKHATNAASLCQMLEPNGIRIKTRRITPPDKKADITASGLVYCGIDAYLGSHHEARKPRYGAAVIQFQMDKAEGKTFYILGTKFYAQECSQQVLCTSKAAEWSVVSVRPKNWFGWKLKPVDIEKINWPIGISRGTGWIRDGIPKDRWIHPEMVFDEDVFIPYESGVRISFVDGHQCIKTSDDRKRFCNECQIMYEKGEKNVVMSDERKIPGNILDHSNTSKLCLDFFALGMLQDPEKWQMVSGLQKKHHLFQMHQPPPGSNGKDAFLIYVNGRMETLRKVLQHNNVNPKKAEKRVVDIQYNNATSTPDLSVWRSSAKGTKCRSRNTNVRGPGPGGAIASSTRGNRRATSRGRGRGGGRRNGDPFPGRELHSQILSDFQKKSKRQAAIRRAYASRSR